MGKAVLALALISLSSCSPDTLRVTCVSKTASVNVKFEHNPFVKDMDMAAVRESYGYSSGGNELEIDNILTNKRSYDLSIKHNYDIRKRLNEYVVRITLSEGETYRCSMPESFIETDVKQIIIKMPLKPDDKNELIHNIVVHTENKPLKEIKLFGWRKSKA